MTNLEKEFFDEYKRVDAICRDMFGAEKGVTTYIEHMKKASISLRFSVSSWQNDYRQLMRMRWLRNVISHENVLSECTQEDLMWLRDFHQRILCGQDSLAGAERVRREGEQRIKSVTPKPAAAPAPNRERKNDNNKNDTSNILWVVVTIIIIAACCALGVGLYFYLNAVGITDGLRVM